ncbi:MAG: hypothetical protein WBZ19_12700 [Chthoniobacterales bacterium]
MKTITQFILLAVALAGVSSCASTSVTKIKTETYAPLSEGAGVTVFSTESEVKQPFAVVGAISYDGPGNNLKIDLGAATEPLKEKAREVGGNAVIIDNIRPIKWALFSTGIHVEARAVHLVP